MINPLHAGLACGMKFKEHSLLKPGRVYIYDNTMFIPEDGTYYSLIFIAGVNNIALNAACDYAISKIKSYTNSLIEKEFINKNL